METKNTGYPTILKYSKINKSPSPVIKTDEERSYVNVVVLIKKVFLSRNTEKNNIKLPERIKVALAKKEMKLSELSRFLGYSSIPGTLKKMLYKS